MVRSVEAVEAEDVAVVEAEDAVAWAASRPVLAGSACVRRVAGRLRIRAGCLAHR